MRYRVAKLVRFWLQLLSPSSRLPGAPSGQGLPPLTTFTNLATGHYLLSFPSVIASTLQVTKLYVGNLPFTATDDGVRALFAAHGTVEKLSLITDRDTGRPRGFGFIEMSNADASRAMQALNGTDFEGRSLKISEAQDKERAPQNSRR
jgi:hypothetical protein